RAHLARPVIKYEITIVSMVPVTRHETALAKLREAVSFIVVLKLERRRRRCAWVTTPQPAACRRRRWRAGPRRRLLRRRLVRARGRARRNRRSARRAGARFSNA